MSIITAGEKRRSAAIRGTPAEETGLVGFLDAKAAAFRDRVALCLFENNQWRELTYAGLASASRRAGLALASRGLGQGSRIAILSESRPEWGIAFFASMVAGATAVLLDPKLMQGELEAILADCRPSALLASRKSLELARALKATAGFPIELLVIDGEGETDGIPCLAGVKARPGERRFPRWSARDTAVLVYTSGTSGKPKGVMTSVSNLLFQVRTLESVVDLRPDTVFLSILPLNHLLELTCGFLGVLHAGKTIVYCQSPYPLDILACMKEKKVTDMVSVPLFLKMLRDNVLRQAQAKGKEAALRRALGIAPHLPRSWRRIVFGKILEAFGGRLRGFVCGGSALDPDIEAFFHALGVVVYQGYGLTETSPVVSANSRTAHKPGTVGRPLPGVEVRVRRPAGAAGQGLPAGVGEILTRGPHVMLGYYGRPDLTREVIDMDGWFATGDLGRLDGEGYLHITGRSKSLIVLPGGKKVQPEEVEEAMSALPAIGEVCVFGRICAEGPNRGNEEVVAVVVPSAAFLEMQASGGPDRAGGLDRVGGLEAALAKAVEDGLAGLTAYKRPSKVLVSREPLPKTPSRKIKRADTARLFEGK